MAATSTPKRKVQVASDIEKNRQEGNWTRCLELTSQLSSDQRQLFQFLTGEAKLEKFLQNCKELPVVAHSFGPAKDPLSYNLVQIQSKSPDDPTYIDDDETGTSRETLLAEAKDHLEQCLSSSADSPLSIDTHLLLAKVYYVSAQYGQALRHIEESGIEKVTQVEKSLPLRVMKLVAESFAVKGMCLEKEHPSDAANDSVKTACLSKATELAIRYLQNLEKMTGPYQIIQLGNILDTAIQKAPMMYVQAGLIAQAVTAYRSFMNAQEIPSTLNLRQFMSRQFAETLLRGVSKSAWPNYDLSQTTVTGPWKPNRYLGQSLYVPKDREEEIILLLLISESLAARNVVLERSPEFADPRAASLSAVTAIYDLLTITLTPVKYFYLDSFERSMKFCYKVKHVWFQFALTLIKSKEAPVRAVKLLLEVADMDLSDPIPLMFAAKQCIEELEDPIQGLKCATAAYERIDKCNASTNGDRKMDLLKSKSALLVGVAHSVIFDAGKDAIQKNNSEHLDLAVKYLKIAIKCNPNDHLPLMHLSLLMASQRLIKQAFQYAQAALRLNPIHLPTIKLVVLILSSLKQYMDALEVVDAALQEYPDHLILLYIKCHLTELVVSRGAAMVIARHMLCVWKNISSDESLVKSCSQYYHRGSILTTGSNLDNVSLKMEITLSEVMSIDSGGAFANGSAISPSITISGNAASVMAGLDKADSHASSSTQSKHNATMFNIHLHIWLLIIELFIKLEQLDQAESAIFEGANTLFGPLSHQMMYVKGLLAKAKGNLEEARTYLQNSVSINPLHSKALQQLAHVYHLLGNHLVAEKYIRDSLKIDATVHESWSYFGLILDALGDHLHACNCQKTALQLESTAPVLTFSLIPRAVFD